MNARTPFLVVSLCLASTVAQAGTVLVIDDFNDPASIRLPGGPGSVTADVGDLGAQRTIESYSQSMVGDPARYKADINTTRPGEYFVDVENGGIRTIIDLDYTFPVSDFSEHEAIILDISSWPERPIDPDIAHVPGLRVVALEAFPRPFIFWLTRFVSPEERRAGRLVLPLDSFTNRAGGPIDADWSVINELQIRVSAAGGWGPWDIAIDRISLGPAIPEPSTVYLAAGCVGWLLLSRCV